MQVSNQAQSAYYAPLDRMRLGVVCAMSFAVSLPIAVISLSKLALVCTFFWMLGTSKDMQRAVSARSLLVHRLIYLAMAAFVLSAFWSNASGQAITKSVTQHGNLLIIPLVFFFVRTRREAVIALKTFMLGQAILLLGSWALYLHLPLPWAQSDAASNSDQYAVFSSYLDQSIMTALFGALAWHLRDWLAPSFRPLAIVVVTLLSIFAVFGIFVGRTGYLTALAMVTLAVYWGLPEKWRLWAILAPVVLAGLVSVFVPQAIERTWLVRTEVSQQLHSEEPQSASTSTGIRLNFWKSALLAIEKNMWIGHGAGSWGQQFDALQPNSQIPGYVPTVGNPHQEYLLWGVELGIPGIVLLTALFASIWRLTTGFEQQAARASQSALVATMLACLFNCSLTDALIGDFLCVALALTLCLGLNPAPHGTTHKG